MGPRLAPPFGMFAERVGSPTEDPTEARVYRAELVRELAEEIDDVRVLKAMAYVPRHLFVPNVPVRRAYANRPAPIGYGQTISQPYIVARMTEALLLEGHERVLEVGTGSGYQAAILATLGAEVYSIEVIQELAEDARGRLARLGFTTVHVRAGDGYAGWPEEAPFDRIIVTAAPEEVPLALVDQLAEDGLLVLPVGPSTSAQRLVRYRKSGGFVSVEDLGGVRFVPMVGVRR